MQIFELKRVYDLSWEDIPFVECPAFAFIHAFEAMNNPNDFWSQVINVREFIAAEFGTYNPLQHYSYAEDRVQHIMQSGEYLSICRSGRPFVTAFTWKENEDHPHKGEWTDPQRYFWMRPNITRHLANIAHQWHKRKSQAFMEELLETPYEMPRAVEEEVMLMPRVMKAVVKKSSTIPIDTSEQRSMSAPKEIATIKKNEDKALNSSFSLLKGNHGSAKNYGKKIIVNDLDEFYKNNKKGIYVASQGRDLQCYNVANGVGLPITSDVTIGQQLKKGMFLEKGTIIMFASKLNNCELGYASNKPERYNYAPGKSSHLAIVSEDFTYDGSEIPVLHQYKSSNGLVYEEIKNHPERSQNHAINNLDNAYVLKIKGN